MALETTPNICNKPLLTDILSDNCSSVPARYIRPASDRPDLEDVGPTCHDDPFPVIDLHGQQTAAVLFNRDELIKAVGLASENDGFFQVTNHGIPQHVIDNMLQVSRDFFKLPESERMKIYSDDPLKTTRLSTSFNIKTEEVSSWRDYLRLHCHPLKDFVHEWPSNPPNFREVVSEYCTNVRKLVLFILAVISESLGLEKEYLNKALGKHGQHMAINYYPPCPQPELTYGLPGHKDPNVITALLQNGVPGLQVLRNGKWVNVRSDPNTLVINIGDQMQVLSNNRYKSVLHRAIVNKDLDRISISTFYSPSYDAVIETPNSLVDEDHPKSYRSYKYAEYYEKFWNRGLNSASCLDLFKQQN